MRKLVNQARNEHLTGIHLAPSQQSSWQSGPKLAKSAVSPELLLPRWPCCVIYIALLFVLMIFIPSVPALNPVLPEMAKSDPFLTRQVENDLVQRGCLQHFSS